MLAQGDLYIRLLGFNQVEGPFAGFSLITGSKVAALLELAFLAPALVDQIVQGAQQATLSTARLVRDEAIPPRWVDQRTEFSG